MASKFTAPNDHVSIDVYPKYQVLEFDEKTKKFKLLEYSPCTGVAMILRRKGIHVLGERKIILREGKEVRMKISRTDKNKIYRFYYENKE